MIYNFDIFKKKVPSYVQLDSSDCGIACLAMISTYFGRFETIGSIKREHSLCLKSSDLTSIIDLSNKLGLISRPIKIEIEQLVNINTPAILHWELDHYVVLTDISNTHVVINDPAYGTRIISYDELSDFFTGIAIEIKTSSNFSRSKVNKSNSLNDVLTLGGYFSSRYFAFVLLDIVIAISFFYFLYKVDELFTRFIIPSQLDGVVEGVFFVSFSLLVNRCLIVIRNSFYREYIKKCECKIFLHLFEKLIRLPLIYFENRKNSTVADSIKTFELIRTSISRLVATPIESIMFVILLAAAVYISAEMALITVSSIIVINMVKFVGNRVSYVENEELIKRDGDFFSKIYIAISHIRQIKIYRQENYFIRSFYNSLIDNQSIGNIKYSNDFKVKLLSLIIYTIEVSLLILIAIDGVVNNLSAISFITLFMILRYELLIRSGVIFKSLLDYIKINKLLDPIFDLLVARVEFSSDKVTEIEINDKLCLSCSNLSFRYTDEQELIFERISFDVTAGQMVSLVSAPGRGKSTLLRVLAGLVEPSDGQLVINGVNINRFGYRNYRQAVSYVSQAEKIFIGTIIDNVTLFDENPDYERYYECIKLVNLAPELQELPSGERTVINEGLIRLAVKQKIGIARALYKKPKIIFLDEATAFCEEKDEHLIMSNIKNIGITCVSISHRTSAIYIADLIFHLDSGKYVDKYIPETYSWR